MLGCYDFCGHYEWTFHWLEEEGGPQWLERYWHEAIALDSQSHAWELIVQGGVEGMQRYWGFTLAEEAPDKGYYLKPDAGSFRCDIHACPSKGFLKRNNLKQHRDYCDHCYGWIKPIMDEAGFSIHHEHNHEGQCWWQFSPKGSEAKEIETPHDVRTTEAWHHGQRQCFRPEES